MRTLIFALALLMPATGFAAEVRNINAKDYDCSGIVGVIRADKKVFVRTGFGGRSFRYPPARCNLGDMYTTVQVRDKNGRQCTLQYACITDPSSFRNFSFGR